MFWQSFGKHPTFIVKKLIEISAGVVFKEVREKPKVALMNHLQDFLESIRVDDSEDENELICQV